MRGCGRLGGIFNNNELNSFSSLESLGFIRNGKQTFFCALIYRSPKADIDFIQEFSEFLLFIRVKYDKVHILGDFRIHGCCPYLSSLSAECIHLYLSFNFEQCWILTTTDMCLALCCLMVSLSIIVICLIFLFLFLITSCTLLLQHTQKSSPWPFLVLSTHHQQVDLVKKVLKGRLLLVTPSIWHISQWVSYWSILVTNVTIFLMTL